MFDEKDPKWIIIYRGFTKVIFWLYVIATVMMFFAGWSGAFWWTDSEILDGLICLVSGGFAAFIHLMANMLIIQFLSNIQLIREKLEKQ